MLWRPVRRIPACLDTSGSIVSATNGRLLMTHTEASTPPGERESCAALFRRSTAVAFTPWVGQLSGSPGREAGGPSVCGAYSHARRWVGLSGSELKQRLNRPDSRAGLRGARGSEGGSRWDSSLRRSLSSVSVGRGLLSLEVCCGGAYTPRVYRVPLPLPTTLSNGISPICTWVKEGRLVVTSFNEVRIRVSWRKEILEFTLRLRKSIYNGEKELPVWRV